MVYCHLPKTREEAKANSSVCYYTGTECKNGHIDKRYTNTGICYECKRINIRNDNIRHKGRIQMETRRSYEKHKTNRLAASLRWSKNNRKKSNDIKKAWAARNQDKVKSKCKSYNERMRQDPLRRLSKNTSKGVWDSLKHLKGGRHWETVVGYTLEQLQSHLENKFTSEMSWDNYCTYWELDHIKPVTLCDSFEEAWAITNLQPLPCSLNRSKCNRYIG